MRVIWPLPLNVSRFHHLAVQVRDVERVAGFYRDVLGLTEKARHLRPDGSLRSIWIALGEDSFIAVEHAPDVTPPGGLGYSVIALRIPREERAGAIAELQRRGIAIEHQTRWTVYFRDPEGNRIALSHHPADPAG